MADGVRFIEGLLSVDQPALAMPTVFQASVGRLYPSSKAEQAIGRIGGQCRALWNHFLAANRDRYQAEQKFIFHKEMSAALPALRREDRFAGLPSRCAQKTVQKLNRALRDCSKRADARKGFPKFKCRDDRNDAFQFVGCDLRLAPGKIRLQAIGWVRARGLRVPDGARLVQATIRQVAHGWDIAVEFEAAPPVVAPAPTKPVVGIDLGLSRFATLSNGNPIDNPRLARKAEKRIPPVQSRTRPAPQGAALIAVIARRASVASTVASRASVPISCTKSAAS